MEFLAVNSIVYAFIWFVLGLLCYQMAGTRGRDKILGLILGLLFGLIAVIGYAIVGDTEEMKIAKAKELYSKFH